jgi:hypothetical protein
MQSFVAAPQVHVAALKNPAMLGGPFINYGAERGGDVKALIEKTVKGEAPQLELRRSRQVARRDARGARPRLLAGTALRGKCPTPERLRRAGLRPQQQPVRPLHRRAALPQPFYDTAAQSVALSLVERDDRSLRLQHAAARATSGTAPRLPVRPPGLDELFKMKSSRGPRPRQKRLLGVGGGEGELFSSFFTRRPPPPPPTLRGDGRARQVFGHACVLIETKRQHPLRPRRQLRSTTAASALHLRRPAREIDYVLITHNHQDHCMFETLLQLRHKIKNVVVPKKQRRLAGRPVSEAGLAAHRLPAT